MRNTHIVLIISYLLCIIEMGDEDELNSKNHYAGKERIDRMLAKYQQEVLLLPKGTLSEKEDQAIDLLLFEIQGWEESDLPLYSSKGCGDCS